MAKKRMARGSTDRYTASVEPLRQTAFRLNDADLALLDAARDRLGLTTRTEALRYVLRQWADDRGVHLEKTKPKRRRTKR